MLREKTFDTGDIQINIAEGPPCGPPLVLLHGIPGRWQEFIPILPHLTLSHHVYALDLRGHGKSGRAPDKYHWKYYSRDLISVLEQYIGEPSILFGMSAGGLIALDIAAIVPDKVKAIVVGDSPIDIEWLRDWMLSEGFRTIFSAFRALASSDLSINEIAKEISEIQIPVPGQEANVSYGDQPGIDTVSLWQLATTLKDLDPGVLKYHAEGRAEEYLEDFHLDRVLEQITCPVLLLQGNPSLDGMMTDRSVKNAMTRLEKGCHIFFEHYGHDLGLDSWKIEALLKTVSTFLGTI
jgi:pimeloyl-ACP methyl ester carboxylesterase